MITYDNIWYKIGTKKHVKCKNSQNFQRVIFSEDLLTNQYLGQQELRSKIEWWAVYVGLLTKKDVLTSLIPLLSDWLVAEFELKMKEQSFKANLPPEIQPVGEDKSQKWGHGPEKFSISPWGWEFDCSQYIMKESTWPITYTVYSW